MSELPEATRAADEYIPPMTSGVNAGTTTSTTTSAAELDLGISKGAAQVTFQARGGDVYVRFRAASSAAGTTSGDSSNGYKIPDGGTKDFWITPRTRYCDHICSAASKTLFWWVSSPNYNNR